ncbi:urease accessory protein UreE [Burkholderia gladioli]|uniref:Urease accessory protein UreE n=1 Tax=Burkholderia gladioli TaxID=28095 RepID=A0A2A7S7W4_BURGA|nr:urease accessory protein UreE [Burkholderia gladioli]MBU9168019.1 urease accessory protein UreE [Burkholderia gladioli]MBU9197214.1 urease accessory protein UreE [Burkholderia gladioli]MBU9421127.1 urease accessory protein UreE [Burkholderia gladioli]MDN7918064.1 urease accessory protein UreE [Burkholderia gladioli]MDN8058589.1 urease accessory protein UreE [Burkholderia gladioli]
MRTLDKRIAPNVKLAASLVARAPTLTLAYDARCRSRFAATLDSGEELAVVLPRGTVLADGDVLVADDGALVRVVAAAEAVMRVRAPDALTFTRAAYHLGNRHTPVEIGLDTLKLEYDPVLADMLTRLGARVERVEAPFQPEAGAYGGGHRHGHDASFAEDYALAQQVYGEHHGHAHGHDHAHGAHTHQHGHDHAHHGAAHEHGHAHSHSHDHEHAHGAASHAHSHEHRHDHEHRHGDDCKHCHDHGHD